MSNVERNRCFEGKKLNFMIILQSCLFNCDICVLALQNTRYIISINGLIVKVYMYHQTKLVKDRSEGKGIVIVVRDKLQDYAKMEKILLNRYRKIFSMTKLIRRFQLANALKNTGKSLLAKWEWRTGREQKKLFTGRL